MQFYKELLDYLNSIKADYKEEIKNFVREGDLEFAQDYEFAYQELIVTIAYVKGLGHKYGFETNKKLGTH